MWLLFYPKTCQKQQLFSHCCFPQTTLCQDYVIAALENCRVKALASLPVFFKVLVNPSHFLQEVSQKLGGVMFLLHFSDINHYYVHARSQVLPQGGFDAELASQDSQQWGHPAAVPDRWCMQRATASPTNSSPKNSSLPKEACTMHPTTPSNHQQLYSFSWWHQNGRAINPIQRCLGAKKNHPQNHSPQLIISYNLFSKLSFKI